MSPDTDFSALRVGDKVTIRQTRFASESDTIGRTGKVASIEWTLGRRAVLVSNLPGDAYLYVYATRVVKVADEAPAATDEVLIDAKRAQAVAAAQLLPDLLVDDHLKVAAFILSEPFAELVADELVAASTETLRLEDNDRDAIEVRFRGTFDSVRPVSIQGNSTYLTLDQVDELIGRLQAFKAAATSVPF
jgi:hypothetical protein